MKPEQKSKRYLFLALAAAICIAVLGLIGTVKLQTQQTQPAATSSRAASSTAPTEETRLDAAKASNAHTVAWLTVPNTDIDDAVMQTTDNEYYLYRDAQGKQSEWGSYFADYYANLAQPSSLVQNTVLYGHTGNTEDPNGQKFSQLFRYLELDFLRNNPNIYVTVNNERLIFEIFAVFYTDIDFYYIDPSPSDQGFDAFIQEVNAKNEFVFEGSPVTQQDKLLTLSGCSQKYDVEKTGNHRFVVMARLVTQEKAGTAQAIAKNPSPKRP